MGLTDNNGLDGNHGGHNDKSGINDGPGSACIHSDSMILAITAATEPYQISVWPGKETH